MTDQEINFLRFNNPTSGEMVFAEAVRKIAVFMNAEPERRYKVMIGSDSSGNVRGGVLDLVSVIAVHRVGNGGRYFWHRSRRENIHNLRQKIYAEVGASLQLASIFFPAFQKELKDFAANQGSPFDFEIHVDVGRQGETKTLIQEITGMVRGHGYAVLIKPESAAATTVADRHVR